LAGQPRACGEKDSLSKIQGARRFTRCVHEFLPVHSAHVSPPVPRAIFRGARGGGAADRRGAREGHRGRDHSHQVVGCGGRGSGAAAQALTADSNTELRAMGDVFREQLDTMPKNLGWDMNLPVGEVPVAGRTPLV